MQTSFKRREARRPARRAEDEQKSQDRLDLGHAEAVGETNASNAQAKVRTLGLRPSPFPSPTPLFSSGLASFDDLINGHGIPSSSLLTLCPALGLTSLTAEAGIATTEATQSGSRRKVGPKHQIDQAAKQKEELKLAQDALNDLAGYGIAQGALAGHDNLVVAHDVKRYIADRLPSYLSGRYRKAGDEVPQHASSSNANGETKQAEEMKIAFRYAHRPQFKTTVAEPEVVETVDGAKVAEEHRYCAPFDMSSRLSTQDIEQSQLTYEEGLGGIRLIEASRYADTFDRICAEMRSAPDETAIRRPIRIHLLDLGGEAWSRGPTHESMEQRVTSLTKFMLRIRGLLKASTLDANGAGRESICTAVISPQILHSPWRTLVSQHLLRLTDIHVLLSDFSCDDTLRRAYSAYAGSVTLVKGPAIGAGLPPGEHRSILRGGVGESGAENDVGWRRRKRGRGMVLETLHEDVDAAVKDDQSSAVSESKRGDDIEETAIGLPRRRASGKADQPHHHHSPSKVGQSQEKSDGEITVKMPSFRGLASLRERGLQATRLRKQQEDESASNL